MSDIQGLKVCNHITDRKTADMDMAIVIDQSDLFIMISIITDRIWLSLYQYALR